jgi:hypothetical protein
MVAMTSASVPLIRVSQLDERFEPRRRLARSALSGEAVRVARGVYAAASDWRDLDPRERYLLRIRAYADAPGRHPVLSHASAAALHGLPIIGDWPELPHRTAGVASGGRSSAHVVRHSAPLPEADVVEVQGLLVTSIARTVLDLAVASTLVSAVATLDRAFYVDPRGRGPTLLRRDELLDCYARRMPFRGHVRARAVIEFGETGAQTPIESLSRVGMWKAGTGGGVRRGHEVSRPGLPRWPERRAARTRCGGTWQPRACHSERPGRAGDHGTVSRAVRCDSCADRA